MDVSSVYVESPSLDRVGPCLRTNRTTAPHNIATAALRFPFFIFNSIGSQSTPFPSCSMLRERRPPNLSRPPHSLSLHVVLTGWGPGLCQTVPGTSDCLVAGCLRKAAGQVPWSLCFGDGVGPSPSSSVGLHHRARGGVWGGSREEQGRWLCSAEVQMPPTAHYSLGLPLDSTLS